MTKIKKLLDIWPLHTVAMDPWLKEQGIYSDLRRLYIKTGWIRSLGRGAIVRSNDKVEWTGGLYPLQQHLKLPIHIGGKTALEFKGYGHFVKFQETEAYLYTTTKIILPKWFKKQDWPIKLVLIQSNFLPDQLGLIQETFEGVPLILSSPERAFLELLFLIPDRQGFQEAYLITQSLSGLRPKLMQELLQQCISIKTKRLALFLGDFLQHEWFKRLDKTKINLGKGDRMIIKEGLYVKKYQITIPRDFEENAKH